MPASPVKAASKPAARAALRDRSPNASKEPNESAMSGISARTPSSSARLATTVSSRSRSFEGILSELPKAFHPQVLGRPDITPPGVLLPTQHRRRRRPSRGTEASQHRQRQLREVGEAIVEHDGDHLAKRVSAREPPDARGCRRDLVTGPESAIRVAQANTSMGLVIWAGSGAGSRVTEWYRRQRNPSGDARRTRSRVSARASPYFARVRRG